MADRAAGTVNSASGVVIDPQQITGLVLAGGAGQRLGGVDKGLHPFAGKPLIAWMLDLLTQQCGQVRISANRNLAAYYHYGYPVKPDYLPNFSGPLAGIARALHEITTPWLLTVPCDTPLIPADLAQRLAAGLIAQTAQVAIVGTPEQWHPLHALIPRTLMTDLDEYLASGERRVYGWLERHPLALVPFDATTAPAADPFTNLNQTEDFARFA
ncbi:molybdenum cofactor guanylyltransferase MobA [Thiospirillum jenense]|uniref:Molybdenum cofactor guanylyltransferase n=1 Tax=Thiospirillum jenense TaxID=1653858 RepID=A0A839HCP7_9GAMM|nr:molybdenum cofactor guanylyltransferase [Thiospirillum jenense]